MPKDNIKFWTWKKRQKEPKIIPYKEQRKVVVLLLSITDMVGGQGKKREVLDNIISQNYLLLDSHEKELTKSGQEPRWENELAWLRNKLKHGSMDVNAPYGIWGITDYGKKTLIRGIRSFLDNRDLNVHNDKLSESWYRRAEDYYELNMEK
jgi:hypothetical protein